nr:ras-related GTP-binding protein D [Zonotrichia albicollis]
MKAIDEPPYLTVGTDVSAKYRGAFCEAKIKTAKRLVKVKVTFRHDSSTVEVQDDHIKGPLKVGTVVEVKNPDGTYQEAVINKLTDASWYTVVFDDGDEKTLRRSSLCLKGERHFAESETLDQLPLTNPEHFGTPVIGKKTNRGRRSNHIPEEESSSSSSDEDEDDRKQSDELLGKVVCVDCFSVDKKKALWFPALVVCPDCSDDIAVKKDNILVRSFKDGKFVSVPRKDVREISETSPKPDALLKQAFDQALEFRKTRTVPSNWKTELKEDSSSSEAEEEEEDEKEKEDNSSEEEEEIEPFPEERENFLQQLYKFMEDRGTPINKRPVLGYRNLNLFKLFRLVHKLGGFDNIESGAVWKQVYQDLGIPVLNSAAGYNVKCAYRKYLYGFEEYCTSANIEFQMALPEKVTNKPCKDCEKEKELKMREDPEQDAKEIKVDKDERKQEEVAVVQPEEKKSAENDNESKENDKPSVLGNKKNLPDSVFTQPDQEKDLNVIKTEDGIKLEDKEEEKIKEMENSTVNADAEEKEKSGDDTNKEEDEDEEEAEEEEEEEEIVGLAGYADGAESFSDGDAESGGDEAFLDFNDPFSTEVKPRILLMGLRRSGKSSIQKVVFHKMSPNETLFLESTNKICREDVSNSSFVNFQIWDFPGQIDFFDPTFDYEMIFRGTGALIFVIDSQDDYMEALARLHLTVTRAYKVNPDINFEIFIHKVDGLSDDHKIETQRDIHQRANDDLADAGLEKIHLSFYLTSIYDHSIFEAFSKVVQKLIPQLPTLENLLNIFISNSGIEKAFLFDVVSKIYIATDSTPVDMQTYELCCDMIDVVIDISCIYGLKDDGTGTPYDKESMAIIKLNNTTVLYLKEVTKFLALVCFVREESFERKGLIDYNFHCFRKAIQEVFEVRMKVVRSRKHQSHLQKNKRPTPNGTPRMPL